LQLRKDSYQRIAFSDATNGDEVNGFSRNCYQPGVIRSGARGSPCGYRTEEEKILVSCRDAPLANGHDFLSSL
jgi:hypothetical protein